MADEPEVDAGQQLTLDVPSGSASGSRLLWVVLAVIALVTGAVVVTTRGSDAPPRLPLALGSASGAGAAPAADAMMLAPVTYVAGDGLPALGGDAPAYRIDGSIDAARVRSLARAVGLAGDPVQADGMWRVTDGDATLEVAAAGGGSWWFSPTAGVVSSDGGTASGGSASGDASSGAGCSPGPDAACTPPAPPQHEQPPDETQPAEVGPTTCPPGAACSVPACPRDATCATPIEPAPPVDLPTKAEARTIALDLLAATGLDTVDADVVVDGPHDAWYITVTPRVDGLAVSGWQSSVAVGSKGDITSASGMLGSPVKLGSYPLLDTHASIDRLNEQGSGGYGGGPVPMGAAQGVGTDSAPTAVDQPASVGSTSSGSCKTQPDGSEICQSVGTDDPPVCVAPQPAPVPQPAPGSNTTDTAVAADVACPEPVPYEPPAPITVTLTGVEQVLMVQYAIDGSNDAYLVPAYRFSNDDGYAPEVVAVADDSLAPTPTTVSPGPKPTGSTPAPVEPQPGVVPPAGGAGTPTEPNTTAKP